jgi:hypothetical protein
MVNNHKLCPFLAAAVVKGGTFDLDQLEVVADCVGEKCALWHMSGTTVTRHGRCAIWTTAQILSKP